MPKEQGVPEIMARPELRVVILGIPCFEGGTWHKMHQVQKFNRPSALAFGHYPTRKALGQFPSLSRGSVGEHKSSA
jgi:hypothetical protein